MPKSSSPRRVAGTARRRSERRLERALDAMHATRDERVRARSIFANLVSQPEPVSFKEAVWRATTLVRKTSADATEIAV